MKYIRKIRRSISKDRKSLIKDLLFYLAGIVTLPTIAAAFGYLEEFSSRLLSSMVLIESLILIILIFAYIFLHDKFSIASDYFKRNEIHWQQLESDAEFDDAFKKAIKEDK